MLRGEHKAPYCTDGVVVVPGRKMEAVDSDGVDTSENRPKETGEGGMVTGVVIVESTAVGTDEREMGTEDDRAVLDEED
jgi:hypothetical protein